jgi:selenide,water dikinase
MALALLGMPIDKIPLDVIRRIAEGGQSVCNAVGIPIAGGHTIDSAEPIYGLVALGLVHPSKVKRNSAAQAGDVLILGKPLGVGVYSAALKKGALDSAGYAQMMASTTLLNTPGRQFADMPEVHAMTDVTGFGLLGHLNEIALGSGLAATVDLNSVPWLPGVEQLAASGYLTGASNRNWAGYGQHVTLHGVSDLQRALLTDPQTSGGLLIACAPASVDAVLAVFRAEHFVRAAVVGSLAAGHGITVRG